MECNVPFSHEVIITSLPSQIPHPPPPPAYEPVEAVWVNYTVEKEDGAFTSQKTIVENVVLGDDYTYFIENATLGATYTITVSALNQLGWSGSTITVDTCKHRTLPCPNMQSIVSTSECLWHK